MSSLTPNVLIQTKRSKFPKCPLISHRFSWSYIGMHTFSHDALESVPVSLSIPKHQIVFPYALIAPVQALQIPHTYQPIPQTCLPTPGSILSTATDLRTLGGLEIAGDPMGTGVRVARSVLALPREPIPIAPGRIVHLPVLSLVSCEQWQRYCHQIPSHPALIPFKVTAVTTRVSS